MPCPLLVKRKPSFLSRLVTDYDDPWKDALSPYFRPFLTLLLPKAHAEIDLSRGRQSLDQDLRQVVCKAKLGPRRVGNLVQVWLYSGREQWILVHIDVRTSWERDFARRVYTCSYRLFDRYREVVSLACRSSVTKMPAGVRTASATPVGVSMPGSVSRW